MASSAAGITSQSLGPALGVNQALPKPGVVSVYSNDFESMEEVRAQCLCYFYDSDEEEPEDDEIERVKRSIDSTMQLVGE